MARARIPSTAALRLLRQAGVEHQLLPYPYAERGGAAAAAEALGLDLHEVVKTLIFEDTERNPLIVLMHGDREVSTNALARAIETKQVRACDGPVAERHSGYRVGGTSPFGTRRAMPVYVERTILDLPTMAINGGTRGLLIRLDPSVLGHLLPCTTVDVAR